MSPRSTPFILHQYEASPFSEKVRKLLAHKGLAWRAVEQPSIMPKPELLPLTGGYRRIPVLQIGADVYCDTQLIVRVLERLAPAPTIYPGASEGTCHAWNLWADRMLFLAVVPVVFGEIGHLVPREFMEDRSKMMPGRDFREVLEQAPHAREQLRGLVSLIEAQLEVGRPYLLGAELGLADAACFHPLWFLRVAPEAVRLLDEFPRVREWLARIDALGHGEKVALDRAEALAIARESEPVAGDIENGPTVSVVPDDYGFDPVTGTLVSSRMHEIALRRVDPDLGAIVVHFPRIGFRIVMPT
jgi:glutathione S-transferase